MKSYDLQYSEMHYSWGVAIMVYHQFGYATGKDMYDSVHRDSQDTCKSEFFFPPHSLPFYRTMNS